MKTVTSLFLQGLAAVLPIALTLYIAYWLLTTVEGSLGLMVPAQWYFPGLGWVLALLVILGAGVLMQLFIFERIYGWATSLLNRVPLVRSIFSTFQDLFEFMSSRSDSAASAVVRVTIAPDVSLVGFVTNKAVHQQLPGINEALIAVYLPMSYQLGGYTILVPADRVTRLDISAESAMKLVLTAGLKTSETESAVTGPSSDG